MGQIFNLLRLSVLFSLSQPRHHQFGNQKDLDLKSEHFYPPFWVPSHQSNPGNERRQSSKSHEICSNSLF